MFGSRQETGQKTAPLSRTCRPRKDIMGNFSVTEVYTIKLLSDVFSALLLVVFFFYCRKRMLQPQQFRLFRMALGVNLFSAAAGTGYELCVLYPEHVSVRLVQVLAAAKFASLQFWFYIITLYLLCAAGKEETDRKKLALLFIPAGLGCLLCLLGAVAGFPFSANGYHHIVTVTSLWYDAIFLLPLSYAVICTVLLWKNHRALLSVFLVLAVVFFYLGFMLESSASSTAILAMGLIYSWFCVRNRRSLFTLGSIIILLFIAATLFIGSFTMKTVSSFYVTTVRDTDEKHLADLKETMDGYRSLPWLVDYWASNTDLFTEKRLDEASAFDIDLYGEYEAFLEQLGKKSAQEVTEQDLESFTDRQKYLHAMISYDLIAAEVVYLKMMYSIYGLDVVLPDGPDYVTVLFEGGENYGEPYGLGKKVGRKELDAAWYNFDALYGPEYLTLDLEDYTPTDEFGFYVEYERDGLETPIWFCIFVSYDELKENLSYTFGFRRQTIFTLTIAALVILLILYFSMLRPLGKVTKSVSAYQKDKDAKKAAESLKAIRSGTEIGMLAEEFSSLTKEMERYTKEVAQMAGEKERVSTELRMASQIQAAVLPDGSPSFPDHDEFVLSASMTPAKEVGGDFYDFFLIDDTHLALVIADVSDKGVPAALFMMSAKNLINYRAKQGGTPAEILTEVNGQISGNSYTDMFVTVWMGILDLASGVLTCTNAGHEYPVVRGEDGKFSIYRDRHGLVVGGMEGIRYKDYELLLKPGDAIFVYTDGIAEANNEAGEFYGLERLENALNRSPGREPKELLRAVTEDVNAFSGDAAQFDDMTMLCLEFRKRRRT